MPLAALTLLARRGWAALRVAGRGLGHQALLGCLVAEERDLHSHGAPAITGFTAWAS